MKSYRSRSSSDATRSDPLAIFAFVLPVVLASGIVLLAHGWNDGAPRAAVAAELDEVATAERMALPATVAFADADKSHAAGASLRLAQLHGSKVVLFFYEGASCGPCQQQLIELQQSLPQIQNLKARVVAVSVDPIETSRSLASQLRLGFPILQDVNHQLGSAFGVFRLPSGMDMGPVDSHSILILDPKGRITWKELAPQTMHVQVGHVLAALKT